MEAPINVRLRVPTVAIPGWQQQAQTWTTLNAEIGSKPGYYPLTIKFAYLVSVIHDLCESVAHLLQGVDFARRTSYIPIYSLFAWAIEILGRRVKGERHHHKSTLKEGFQWLADPPLPAYAQVSETTVLINTTRRERSHKELGEL